MLDKQKSKILVFGAGVLGSLYAARLSQAGYHVSLLARGRRLAELRSHGLILEDSRTGQWNSTAVELVEGLRPEDAYDLVLVLVRNNQLPSVLPALAENRNTPNVLFMVNNAAGTQELVAALGRKRVLLGFPGAGGELDAPVVRYHIVSRIIQPTTIGEIDGKISPRLQAITAALQEAGFPVAISPNMDAWLKTHVAVVSPIANAIYLAGGDNYRLARTPDGLVLLVRALKEGFQVLDAHNIPITPPYFRLLTWIPEPVLVSILKIVLNNPKAELVMARHANAARDEMQQLATDFLRLARTSAVPTPAVEQLATYISPATAPMPSGQHYLPLNWQGVWITLTAIVGLLLVARRLFRRRICPSIPGEFPPFQ